MWACAVLGFPPDKARDVVRCDDLRNDEATCERGGPHHEPRRVERSPDRECRLPGQLRCGDRVALMRLLAKVPLSGRPFRAENVLVADR